MTDSGIVSFGSYLPRRRITVEEIASVWGANGAAMSKALGVVSKSVPYVDEDVISIGTMALRYALRRRPVDPGRIGAIYVGSESHPYAVKPSATVIAEAVGATPDLTAADYEFACKAGTAGMQTVMGLVSSGMIEYGVAIGADTSQGAPGDPLEYTASAGGTAFVMGRDPVARILGTSSFTTDTPDFWRREGQPYPSHGGRFTGVPAYFRHVVTCGQNMMEQMGTEPKDYDFLVLHQPNGKFPVRAAGRLGFPKEKLKTGLLTPRIGNTYSGSAMTGLSAVLDVASPGDRILMVSYGSGAGSDAFDIEVTDLIEEMDRNAAPSVEDQISRSIQISYSEYAKLRGKIVMPVEVR